MSTSVWAVTCPACMDGEVYRAPGSIRRFCCDKGPGTLWFGVGGIDGWPEEDETALGPEVGYRVGIGEGKTAFQWLCRPSEMEAFRVFIDDYGRVHDRDSLIEFVTGCDEQHERGCECDPVRHPPGMWERRQENRE